MEAVEANQVHQLNEDLKLQLQCVFDACDSDNSGTISLRDLADLSRGHVGSGDVEQVLQILGPGDDDKINFSQFCSRVMTIMNSGAALDTGLDNSPVHSTLHSSNSPVHALHSSPLHTSANSPLNRVMDNSPLKIKRSPRRTSAELNNSGSPAKRFGRKNSKHKLSQGQVVGRIPLVNTSSEEDDDLEDSFDRKIAASLETARPNRMIPDTRTVTDTRKIPDNTHKAREVRVNSLSNSPAKAAGFSRTGMMRSTVRRSTSRLPSGIPPVQPKAAIDDHLSEESFSSPLTGCPPGETLSPVLPRSNFSNSSSPLSSSPSEISSTVFKDETPNSSRLVRKDSSRKSSRNAADQTDSFRKSSRQAADQTDFSRTVTDSSRQTPVTVQGVAMAPNRDTPLRISETESPAISKVSVINSSARDNTTVIQVLSQDLEEDFSTLDRKAPSPSDYDSPSSGVGSSTGWTSSGTGGWTSGVGSSNGEGTGGWSSGVGSTNGVSTVSIRADLEEDMSSSIQRVRKMAEEKAKAEKMRHQEEMEGMHRERALERKNFQLRLEQFQTEKEQMKNEIMTLREKVKLLHLEKENTEEQLMQMAEQNEQVAVQEQVKQEEQEQKQEEELLIQLNQLSTRVTSQDSELAEVREDNSILRSQNKKLKEAMHNINKDKDNKFRIFGAAKEPVPSWTDPSWDDPTDVRKRVRRLEEELADQREVNSQLKSYVGEVLVNIMVKNPQILEKN